MKFETWDDVYKERYKQFCKHQISYEEWYEFCAFLLDLLMEENEDILKSLKY